MLWCAVVATVGVWPVIAIAPTPGSALMLCAAIVSVGAAPLIASAPTPGVMLNV